MLLRTLALLVGATLAGPASAQSAAPAGVRPHNVVLFVPDGLRSAIVRPDTAPEMARVRAGGVDFRNSHALFPTFTTPNASAMATGHQLGDTGDFSNTIFTGYAVGPAGGSMTPFIENDPILGDVDDHFGGDYLNEETVMRAARDAGFGTASIGKLGPTLIFDHTARDGTKTVVLDDSTGGPGGMKVPSWLADGLREAGLPPRPPGRGDNGIAGSASTPGTRTPNLLQQAWFADALTRVVLPRFKADDRPFFVVFWSRDPDGTQHNQGDSPLRLLPGINGPTSLAAIRNADNNLAQIRRALAELGLADTTDVIVSADHGFSTIGKESDTSAAARGKYDDTPPGLLPGGFLGLDLAKSLGEPLFDPDNKNARMAEGQHTKFGNGLIGPDPARPVVAVAANGGSDLVYLPGGDKDLARRVVDLMLAQDYASGVFVDDGFGPVPGTLPLSAVNLHGAAVTPVPTIVVNFRSFATGCAEPTLCAVEVSDSNLQQGQGMHGSFSRADTWNFEAAIGPDFRSGFVDPLPSSNADIGRTISSILGLSPKAHGTLVGRVLTEAMPNGATPERSAGRLSSDPAGNGLTTVLDFQTVGAIRYLDAAGFAGRTVGLAPAP